MSDNLKNLTKCPKHFLYFRSKVNWNIIQKSLAKKKTEQHKAKPGLQKENQT